MAVVLIAQALTDQPEVGVGSAGAILQLIGLVVAGGMLLSKLRQFSEERLTELVGGLLSRKTENDNYMESLVNSLTASDLTDAAVQPGANASAEDLFEIAREDLEALRSRVEASLEGSRQERAALKRAIEGVESNLRRVEKGLEELVKRLAVGSVHWEVTGLFWIFVGVILTTWSGPFVGFAF